MTAASQLKTLIERIQPLDQTAIEQAAARQNTLTKPPGSLGKLEAVSIRMAGIQRTPLPRIKNKAIVVMAGDHGVTAEGVSAFPGEVTPQMVFNMVRGGAAINVLARHNRLRLVLVDLGVAFNFPPDLDIEHKKIAPGTQNLAVGPAMTEQQALEALFTGVEIINREVLGGLEILATGDMGIGNTTPSAAIAAALSGHPAKKLVGRGTGVDDEGLARKLAAVEKGLLVNQPDGDDGLDVLAKVGGFEIAGLAGAMLSAASHRCAVVIDGFISTAAAMIAASLAPQVKEYLFAGHRSQESGHQLMLGWLGLDPLLDLDLRLGEGTGAVLAVSLVEASCRILTEMATFEDAGIDKQEG